MHLQTDCILVAKVRSQGGGTAAVAPSPFRPGEPVLCGSCPLVTTYYCRLGELLYLYPFVYYCVCTMHMSILLFALSDFSFVDLPSVL